MWRKAAPSCCLCVLVGTFLSKQLTMAAGSVRLVHYHSLTHPSPFPRLSLCNHFTSPSELGAEGTLTLHSPSRHESHSLVSFLSPSIVPHYPLMTAPKSSAGTPHQCHRFPTASPAIRQNNKPLFLGGHFLW